MLKNYFKTAIRSLLKRKIFSLINVVGLAIGISASLIVLLIVKYEFSFDTQHKDKNKIYRIVSESGGNGEIYKNPGIPVPLQTAIQNEMSGVEIAVPFILKNYNVKVSAVSASNTPTIKYKDNANIIFANANYFKLIQYKWLAGNANNVLNNAFQTVLTEARAKVYFPNTAMQDIVGKQIVYDDSITSIITGVVKALEGNSDFNFKEFISLSTFDKTGLKENYNWDDWNSANSDVQLFVKLSPNVSTQKMNVNLTSLYIKHKEENATTSTSKLKLQPLSDLHFNSDYDNFNARVANKSTLYGLLIVACILLLLGCINFINLSTAQATDRAKEIGIRKTIGAYKTQLVFQFLTETFLLTLIAGIISVLIAPLILQLFKDFIPAGITSALVFSKSVLTFLLVIIFIISLLAGLYPSFVLTKFKPVLVLKGQTTKGSKTENSLRKILTVSQFAIAQFFIIVTLVLSQQMHFSLSKDLGYKKDAIVFLNLPWNNKDATKKNVLLEKIKTLPNVEMVCLAGNPPSSGSTSTSGLTFTKGTKKIENDVEYKYGDSNYFNLYHLKLLAGRTVLQSDTITEYIINETYSKILGFAKPEDAIGQMLEGGMSKGSIPIVGVMADFHTKSTRVAIKPLLVASCKRFNNYIHFSFAKTSGVISWQSTLQQIGTYWKEVYPQESYEYKFFDESIAAFYKSEMDMTKLLKWTSGLTIFISCLGLLGLVVFMANKRTKEIGVRKILGASSSQIVALLSKEFIALVFLALLIATPVAWYFTSKWLQDFAYRINMPIWVFVVTGLCAIVIAFATVFFQTIKAAIANPIKSLRTE
jgi:putative ABC transport system permease protein